MKENKAGKYTYDNNYNHVVDSIDVIYDNNSGVTPYIVYFDKKGTYKKFYCCNGVFEEEPLDDIYLPLSGFDKWQVVNDSMFTAGRDTYTVIDSFRHGDHIIAIYRPLVCHIVHDRAYEVDAESSDDSFLQRGVDIDF